MQRACEYSSKNSSNLRVNSGSIMCPEVNRHAPPSSDTIQTKPFPIRGNLNTQSRIVVTYAVIGKFWVFRISYRGSFYHYWSSSFINNIFFLSK